MPCPAPLHEPAGLVADGIVGGVGERPHRRRADIGARGIGIIFGAGRAILQIIASADLRHPSPLHEGLDRRTVRQRAAVILAEAFPAMMIGIEQDERYAGRAIGHLAVREVDRRAIDRKDVRRVPIEIPALVVVLKQVRVPGARRHLPRLDRILQPRFYRAGQRRHAADVIVDFAARRVFGAVDRALRRHRRHDEQARAVGRDGRRDDPLGRPAARRDEVPREEVGRSPISVGERQEQIIGALERHDHRVGTGAVRHPLVHLLEIVAIVDVDRIGVGLRRRGRQDREQQGHRCACTKRLVVSRPTRGSVDSGMSAGMMPEWSRQP